MSFTVAIDGPAGAGKSTVARNVAQSLGFTYIDTGAMYRALAWLALQQHLSFEDGLGLEALATTAQIVLSPLSSEGKQQVWINDFEVTEAIRTPEISQATSKISALPAVRIQMVSLQRNIAIQSAGVVLEGRDIGTVVFPNAEVKIFLTATPEERARRRWQELKARGESCDYETVLADQKERDARDSQRAASPLVAAPDALLLPTDGLNPKEVTERILEICGARGATKLGTKP